MSGPLAVLNEAGWAFLVERHLATLTTIAVIDDATGPVGSREVGAGRSLRPHVVPVGFTVLSRYRPVSPRMSASTETMSSGGSSSGSSSGSSGAVTGGSSGAASAVSSSGSSGVASGGSSGGSSGGALSRGPADGSAEDARSGVRGSHQPGVDQPGVDQSGVDQSGVDQPGVDEHPGEDLVRIITFADAVKVRHADRGCPAAVCQVDGGRWITLEGTARVRREPEVVAAAVAAYAQRYRPPRPRADRVVIEIVVERVMCSSALRLGVGT